MNRLNLSEIAAGVDSLSQEAGKALDPKLLLTVAALALGACKNDKKVNSKEGEVSVADSGTDSGADSGTDSGTDSGADSGTDSGTDAGADSGTGTDSGSDTGTPGVTTMAQADCEALLNDVMPDVIGTTYVSSGGAACAYDVSALTFSDGNYNAATADGASPDTVYACAYNSDGIAAETTTVSTVDGALNVDAQNLLLGADPVVQLRFVNNADLWLTPDASTPNPAWTFLVEEGACVDISY